MCQMVNLMITVRVSMKLFNFTFRAKRKIDYSLEMCGFFIGSIKIWIFYYEREEEKVL